MVRLFASLILLLCTAVSGIIATPTISHAELAKRDVPAVLDELAQLKTSVQILQTGVAQISGDSSPNDVANFNLNVQAVLRVITDLEGLLSASSVGILSNSDAMNIVSQVEGIVAIIVSTLNALVNDVEVLFNTIAGPELRKLADLINALGAALDTLLQILQGDVNPTLTVLISGLVKAKADADHQGNPRNLVLAGEPDDLPE